VITIQQNKIYSLNCNNNKSGKPAVGKDNHSDSLHDLRRNENTWIELVIKIQNKSEFTCRKKDFSKSHQL